VTRFIQISKIKVILLICVVLRTVNSYANCDGDKTCLQCIKVGCVYGVTSSSTGTCFNRDEIPVGILATFRTQKACQRVNKFGMYIHYCTLIYSKRGQHTTVKEEIMHTAFTERITTSTTTENQVYTSELPTFTTRPTTHNTTTNYHSQETSEATQSNAAQPENIKETTTDTAINTNAAGKVAMHTTIFPIVESTTHVADEIQIEQPTTSSLLDASNTTLEPNSKWHHANLTLDRDTGMPRNVNISIFIKIYCAQPIPIPSIASKQNMHALIVVLFPRLFHF
ncbi:hypothetical protein Fcan01_11685, partial [Folsomia candida]